MLSNQTTSLHRMPGRANAEQKCYPEMKLINPALEQANAVKAYLAKQNALNPQKKGKFIICTSGDPQVYVNVGKRLGLFEASELKVVHI